MLVDYLSQYGLFLAKILTFIFGLLFLVGAILTLLHKTRQKAEGTLQLAHINHDREELQEQLQKETLEKSAFKAWRKQQKIQKKAKKREKSAEQAEPRLFVVRFDGDIRATQVNTLRQTITAIIDIATPADEVLLILESMGGMVHSYGLAASQLDRLRQQHIPLTVAIDKVAASGGYMMAVVANTILAAPFAIVGSIGVIAQLPNFNRFLDKHNIDFELQTAGEYKRTLTIFGKNTDKGRQKFQQEIEETHVLFKNFIQQYRPQLNIDEVATGEHWYALDALKYQLIDTIITSDSFITDKVHTHQIYEITYEESPTLTQRIFSGVNGIVERCIDRLLHTSTERS